MTSNHPLTPALAGFLVGIGAQGGFLDIKQRERLIAEESAGGFGARLLLVLVRCNQCRFMCPVQDVRHLMACIAGGSTGDFVRDVSILPGDIERAKSYLETAAAARKEGPPGSLVAHNTAKGKAFLRGEDTSHYDREFNEADCGGVFDGHQVISDADPGL